MKRKVLYHNILFLIGFVYYLVVPVIVGYTYSFSDYPGMRIFYSYFPSQENLSRYIILSGILLFAFYAGSYLALKFRSKELPSQKKEFSFRMNKIVVYALVLVNQLIIIQNRGLLFSGYTLDYDIGFLGQLATLNCIYIFLYLLLKHRLLGLLVLENSIVLLGLGSRMFVMIPIVAFIVYLIDQKRIKVRSLLIFSSIIVVFMLLVGTWRSGNLNIDLETVLYIGFAEPVYTWISAGSFLNLNPDIDIVSMPTNFLGHFINFIPTVLFPNKASFIQQIPYPYDTPFGASSIFLNLYGNFGVILTPLVAFAGAFLLTYIRFKKNPFFQAFYYCCCGMIPFLLFRDLQSFNKILFMSFLIYPFIILYPKIKNTNK